MPQRYDLEKIKALLTEIFTDEELRRFCYDTPEFVPVYKQLRRDTPEAQVIRQLVNYANQNSQLEILLNWAKTHTPTIYEKYQPYYTDIPPLLSSAADEAPSPPASSEPPLWKRLSSVNVILGIIAGLCTITAAVVTIWGGLPLSGLTTTSTTSLVAPATTAATFTPIPLPPQSSPPSKSSTTAVQSEAWATCQETAFVEVDDGRWARMEVGMRGRKLDLSQDDQASQDDVGPFGVELTQDGQPLAVVQFLHFPSDEFFKIMTIIDAHCNPIVDYTNDTRGGDKNSLQNWDVLKFYLEGGAYTLRFGDQGSAIWLSFQGSQEE